MLLPFTFDPNHNNQLQRLLPLCDQLLYPKEAYQYERCGWCHHAVILQPACTGPGTVQGATRQGIERCDGCTQGGWVPPRCGRAPAPPKAFLDVEYCLVDFVLPRETDGKLSLLLCFNFPRERNGRQEEEEGGGIDPRPGNQIKKEDWVSEQYKSRAKTSIAYKQQQQPARGRTNANAQNVLTFLISYRTPTSPRKSSSSSHGELRCRLNNCV